MGETRPCVSLGARRSTGLERVVCDALRERRANHSGAGASLSRLLLESRRVLERLGRSALDPPARWAAAGGTERVRAAGRASRSHRFCDLKGDLTGDNVRPIGFRSSLSEGERRHPPAERNLTV